VAFTSWQVGSCEVGFGSNSSLLDGFSLDPMGYTGKDQTHMFFVFCGGAREIVLLCHRLSGKDCLSKALGGMGLEFYFFCS